MFHFDETSIIQGRKDLFDTYPRLVSCLETALPRLDAEELTPSKLYNL
jgi:hypothetical protein